MATDFDDIFGDLKESEGSAASRTNDLDESGLFDDPLGSTSSARVIKNQRGKQTPSTVITGRSSEQDDFLSWLDDGPVEANSTASASHVPSESPVLGAPFFTSAEPVASTTSVLEPKADDDAEIICRPAVPTPSTATDLAMPPPPATEASHLVPTPVADKAANESIIRHDAATFDDDDDDDLESFIVKAAAHAKKRAGPQEASHSSLSIKSQRNESVEAQQFDTVEQIQRFLEGGVLAIPSARIAMWQHSIGATLTAVLPSTTRYTVQTTQLNLPNQLVLRKEVENVCTSIFTSSMHSESARVSDQDSAYATRLLFIDNAEILLTFVCKKLNLAAYPSGLALTFAPAMAASNGDPLRMDLIATLTTLCQRMIPHLGEQGPRGKIASERRLLLKWLLLYHAPRVAFHLDQHFYQWYSDKSVIPDSWILSMFENDTKPISLDVLIKVWDCCLLFKPAGSFDSLKEEAFQSTANIFIIVALVAKAEQKLVRMGGEQLQHFTAKTLIETLSDKNETLIHAVQRLVALTPPSFFTSLRNAGHPRDSETPVPVISTANAETSGGGGNNMMSLFTASTNGMMQVGSAVMNMPTNLMTTIVPQKPTSPMNGEKKKSNEDIFHQLMHDDATAASNVCLSLPAKEVIPQIFASFHSSSPNASDSIRYFILDCRAHGETCQGQVPTAFHFDPDAVTNPDALDLVLATLNPMKNKVHMCVMGYGYGHFAQDLRTLHALSAPTGTQSSPPNEIPLYLMDDYLEAFARDTSRVSATVLFLTKQGFPFISVLEGGYAAAHAQLLNSCEQDGTVADLTDHDAAHCQLCRHQQAIATLAQPSTAKASSDSNARPSNVNVYSPENGGTDTTQSTVNKATSPVPHPNASDKIPDAKTHRGSINGVLNPKALFSAESGSAYLSSFAGVVKTSGKAILHPTDALKDSKAWFTNKTTGNSTGSDVNVHASPSDTPDGKTVSGRSTSGTFASFTKFTTHSLSNLGAESLCMLKKAEQATVASANLKGIFGGSSNMTTRAKEHGIAPTSPPSNNLSAAVNHKQPNNASRNTSFEVQDVFCIDDDEDGEQDDFVGGSGNGSSRTSSTSSMTAGRSADSFTDYTIDHTASTLVLHTVEKGKVNELTKGIQISRKQMQPFVASPFFAAYKKKMILAEGAPVPRRTNLLPRFLVIAENHIVVLKADKRSDDVFTVKSCHHLSHLARMTCLKKNLLMVNVYYRWKVEGTDDVRDRNNAYEVQQRDAFIKVVKTTMEKM